MRHGQLKARQRFENNDDDDDDDDADNDDDDDEDNDYLLALIDSRII